jgi:glycerophosphoryl diester phosphodiesterase
VGAGPRPALEKYHLRAERKLVALLKRYGVANPASPEECRVVVTSYFPEGMKVMHDLAPKLPMMYHALPYQATAAHQVAKWAGAKAVGHTTPQTLRANPDLPDLAAAEGLTTVAAGVDERFDLQYFLDIGVPWIYTDHPARTLASLGRRPTT